MPPPGELCSPTFPASGGGEERVLSFPKTGLRQLEEGARAMRQPLTLGRQSVFQLGCHLAKCKIKSVGEEHRIVAEALLAARRPDQRAVHPALEFLKMAVGPGDGEHRDEMRLAPLRRERVA